MAETLVIRLPDDDSNAAESLLVDPVGAPLGDIASGTLEDAAVLGEGRRVIALVPASQVLRTSADIPLRNKAKIQQALPFALEEQLATDVEGQHFAFGVRDANGRLPVAVVAAATVSAWLERFLAAGIKPDAVFSESDALVAMPSTVTVLVDGERIIIREPDGNTTIADPDSLQAILELLIEDEPAAVNEAQHVDTIVTDDSAVDHPVVDDSQSEPVNILVYCGEDDHERFAIIWDMLRLRVESLDVKILPDGALPRLASQISLQAGVNLLQGPYAPRRELPVDLRAWLRPAVVLCTLLVLLLVRAGVDLWQLNQEEQALDAAARQLLGATFPGMPNGGDPWAQLRSELGDIEPATAAAGAGFADALAALADGMSATPDIRLEALGYRDGNLDLQLVAPSVEKLDLLRQGIVAAGQFAAEIQSANPEGDTIKGRMKISAPETTEDLR